MSFNDQQLKALGAKLNGKHVHHRVRNGTLLSYIEGWHAIAEANRIFGFDGWNRETVATECLWQDKSVRRHACTYLARVRVTVNADERTVIREGTGVGQGHGSNLGEACAFAVKEAETDATKRALSTFGNPFGLALYDKQKRNVRGIAAKASAHPVTWKLDGVDGDKASDFDDPIKLCVAARQAFETTESVSDLVAFWRCNEVTFRDLRGQVPELKADDGRHYTDFLVSLYAAKLQALALRGVDSGFKTGVSTTTGSRGKPVSTPIKKTQRLRNPDHLRFVRSKPCLICGRVPSHAHHVRYAQPSAIGRKVSDQWTVPLCSVHHDAVHRRGDERAWWQQEKIDPLPEAERLWRASTETERPKPKTGIGSGGSTRAEQHHEENRNANK